MCRGSPASKALRRRTWSTIRVVCSQRMRVQLRTEGGAAFLTRVYSLPKRSRRDNSAMSVGRSGGLS